MHLIHKPKYLTNGNFDLIVALNEKSRDHKIITTEPEGNINMCVPDFMAIQTIVVDTFHSKLQPHGGTRGLTQILKIENVKPFMIVSPLF